MVDIPDHVLDAMCSAMLDPKLRTDAKMLDGTTLPAPSMTGNQVRRQVLLRALLAGAMQGWELTPRPDATAAPAPPQADPAGVFGRADVSPFYNIPRGSLAQNEAKPLPDNGPMASWHALGDPHTFQHSTLGAGMRAESGWLQPRVNDTKF